VLAVAVGAALAVGCAHARTGQSVAAPETRGWTVVPHMTIVAQRGDFDCGPAALAMALGRWDAAPSPDAWQPRANVSDGASAGALRDEARRQGFQAFVVEGSFDDLTAEIGAGHPVIVGLVQIEGDTRTDHFAVVVGHDAPAQRWLVADPARGLQTVTRDALDTQWARTRRVTLVLAPKTSDAASRS
jgi:ABC-type bacteriocin/lantibiotic exporter with double-glycine peptidase domain